MFTLPLFDDAPTRRPAIIVWLIIAACTAVFLWQASLPPRAQDMLAYSLGVVPSVVFGHDTLPPELVLVPAWATLVTSMFLHGGWLHLIGNMLFLWIFGDNVEDAMSRPRFVVFYLLCGIAAALAQSLAAPGSDVPMVGASGAIAGVLGAYILLHPRANVRLLFYFIIFIRFINLPAVLVLGFWFVMQFASGAMMARADGGVAFWAHVGGFVAGMLFVPFFKDAAVPFFGGPYTASFAVARGPAMRRLGSVPEAGDYRRGPWR
jgi:membrane associated rhomboid family serine protease